MNIDWGPLGGGGGGGSVDPFDSYMPDPGSIEKLPPVSKEIAESTLRENVSDIAREDPAGFFEKVGRFSSGAWDGLKYGWNFGTAEQAYRSWRTLGVLFGSEEMQRTATEGLDLLAADPERARSLENLEDPVARQAFEGMASVVPAAALALPGVLLGLVTGGAGWVPALVAAAGAGTGGGLAEYDAFIENAHKEHLRSNPYATVDETRLKFGDAAVMSAFAEGGVDAAVQVIGGRLATSVAKPLASIGEGSILQIGDVFNRSFTGRLLKNTLVTGPMSEVPSEMATAAAQDYIKGSYGLDHQGAASAAKDAIIPALIASFPFGAANTIMTNPSAATKEMNARDLMISKNLEISAAHEYVRSKAVAELSGRPELADFIAMVKAEDSLTFTDPDTGASVVKADFIKSPAFQAHRDAYLPNASDDEVIGIVALANSLTKSGYDSLKTQARVLDVAPEVDQFDKFRDFLTGNTKDVTPEQTKYFQTLEDTLRVNLRRADSHGMLNSTAKNTLQALSFKAANVYDSNWQNQWMSLVEGSAEARKLADRVAQRVIEDDPKILFEKNGEKLKELVDQGGTFTLENVMHSGDPAAQAAIGFHYAREAGYDPTKAADGQTITKEMVVEHLKRTSVSEATIDLVRNQGFIASLQDREFLVPTLRKTQEANTSMAIMKLQRAMVAQSGDDPETIAALRASALKNFSTAILADAQIAQIGTFSGRALQQMGGKEVSQVFELQKALKENIESMLTNEQNLTVATVSAWAAAVRDSVVLSTKASTNKVVKKRVENLKAAVENLTELAKANPNMTLEQAKSLTGSLDTGIYDGLLKDVMNSLEDPELVASIRKQLRDSKLGLVTGVAKEFAFNNMLSNPVTPITALMSNGINQFSMVMEKALGSVLLDTKQGFTPRSWRYALRGMTAALFGGAPKWNSFFGPALRGGLNVAMGTQKTRTLVTEGHIESQSVYDPLIKADSISQKLINKSWEEFVATRGFGNFGRQVGNVLDATGYIIRTPSRLLEGVDEIGEVMAHTAEMEDLMASWEERTGRPRSEIPADERAEMNNRAVDAARVATFKEDLKRNDGWFLRMSRKIDDMRNDQPWVALALPFFRVGVNIAYRFATSNPITARFTEYHKAAMRSGDARQIQEADARLLMGSALTYTAMLLASAGLISGAAPTEEKERELWYAAGNQPYSIKIGDTWVGYQRTDPIASFLQMAANLNQASHGLDKKSVGEGFAALFSAAAMSTIDKTFLKGLHGAIGSIIDPAGGEAGSFLANSLSMFMPANSLLRGFYGASTTYTQEAEGTINKLLSKIWTLDNPDVAIKRTALGDPVMSSKGATADYFGGPSGVIAANTIPSEFRSATAEPVYEELYRLKAKGAEVGLSDVSTLTFRTVDGKKAAERELNVKEQERFKELRGQILTIKGRTLKDALSNLVVSPEYLQLPDEDRAKLVGRVSRNYGELARTQLVREFPEIIRRR